MLHNKRSICLWAMVLLTVSCNNPNTKSNAGQSVKIVQPNLDVRYICDFSRDTMLLFRGSNILLTKNAGKSWSSILEFPVINRIVVDDKHTIWAIYYWGGVHEPGSANLFKSTDWGKTWTEFKYDVNKFAPEDIVSDAGKPIRVKIKDQIYESTGNNALKDWKAVAKVGEYYNYASPKWDHKYFAIDSTNTTFIFKRTKQGPSLIFSNDSIGTVHGLFKVKDTLFVTGNGVIDGDFAKPYFAAIIGDKKIKRYKITAHSIDVFKGSADRIWATIYGKLYLKNDTGLVEQKINLRSSL